MSTTDTTTQTLLERPKRADARRNYEKVLTAAREAFAEGGESTALEEIARRAGGGGGAPPPRRGRDRHAVPPLPEPSGAARGGLRRRGRGDLPLSGRARGD